MEPLSTQSFTLAGLVAFGITAESLRRIIKPWFSHDPGGMARAIHYFTIVTVVSLGVLLSGLDTPLANIATMIAAMIVGGLIVPPQRGKPQLTPDNSFSLGGIVGGIGFFGAHLMLATYPPNLVILLFIIAFSTGMARFLLRHPLDLNSTSIE